MNFKPKRFSSIPLKNIQIGTLLFPPQSLITGDKMFMPENTIFLESKLSVGLMAGFQNEF
jgi:hypothetical protein